MKLHIITIGEPKLPYAKLGWQEYLARLRHYHTVRVTHIANKHAYDPKGILQAAGTAYIVALTIDGTLLSSAALADFLAQRATTGKEVCCIIGGPDGLPPEVSAAAQYRLSLSSLTFPHDLAMVILAEALYRASTINAGHPYHK